MEDNGRKGETMRTMNKLCIFATLMCLISVQALAFYDPGVQRWINRDPLGDIASLPVMTADIAPGSGSDNSAEMGDDAFFDAWIDINRNLYGAMGNDPLQQVDPWGLCGAEEAASAAEKAAELAKEALQRASDFAQKTAQDAREAWGKNNSVEAERFGAC